MIGHGKTLNEYSSVQFDVVNYLTASRIVTVGRDDFWGALGIPN